MRFLTDGSWMKAGQCGTVSGYNNGTLIISVFPSRISCQNHLRDVENENGCIRGQDRGRGTEFSSVRVGCVTSGQSPNSVYPLSYHLHTGELYSV